MPKPNALPKINAPLMGGFQVFNRRFLRKHFHAVAINRDTFKTPTFNTDDALVVYANHASWWDPLAALYMVETVFPGFRLYAPIDADAFQKYRIFGQMGFFPVDQTNLSGASDFLRISRTILTQPGASLWITPEGTFVDCRDHSAPLMPGLAHLAASIAGQHARQPGGGNPRVWFIPAALEFTFWEERLPELLIWMGQPVCASLPSAGDQPHSNRSKQEWQTRLTHNLRDAQNQLAAAAIARDVNQFEILLRSRSGTFFLYDWWRSLRGKISGKPIRLDHSDKLDS